MRPSAFSEGLFSALRDTQQNNKQARSQTVKASVCGWMVAGHACLPPPPFSSLPRPPLLIGFSRGAREFSLSMPDAWACGVTEGNLALSKHAAL